MEKQVHFNKFNQGTADFVTPGRQLEYIADVHPDRDAIIAIDKEGSTSKISYDRLRKDSNRLAHFLLERGIGPGSRVMVLYPNCIEHFIAAFAIWKTGACYVPVSHKAAAYEIEASCTALRPQAAFSDIEVPCTTLNIPLAKLPALLENQPDTFPPDVKANPNLINLSGGTTGKMKFIRQTFPCGLDDQILESWFYMSGMEFEERQLLTGPLFHGAPHTVGFNGLFCGNTLIVPRNLCPENILHLIEAYKIEYVQMVPTLMGRIGKLAACTKDALSSIRALCHTGGACPAWLKEEWIELLAPEKVYEIYSMTECIGITCIRGDAWLKHKGSVGRPITGSKVSIRDMEGNEVPPDRIGEIYMTVPGHYRMTEYVNADPLRELPGGFRTVGDLGFVDKDGYLYYADRRTDVIVVGGENVFARQVEEALLRYPKIHDAVVVGLPDEDMGRRLEAVIETPYKIDVAELETFLGQYLSAHKIPKIYHFEKALLRNPSGKPDRKALYAQCVKEDQARKAQETAKKQMVPAAEQADNTVSF